MRFDIVGHYKDENGIEQVGEITVFNEEGLKVAMETMKHYGCYKIYVKE